MRWLSLANAPARGRDRGKRRRVRADDEHVAAKGRSSEANTDDNEDKNAEPVGHLVGGKTEIEGLHDGEEDGKSEGSMASSSITAPRRMSWGGVPLAAWRATPRSRVCRPTPPRPTPPRASRIFRCGLEAGGRKWWSFKVTRAWASAGRATAGTCGERQSFISSLGCVLSKSWRSGSHGAPCGRL
jgi:hypothetical protein